MTDFKNFKLQDAEKGLFQQILPPNFNFSSDDLLLLIYVVSYFILPIIFEPNFLGKSINHLVNKFLFSVNFSVELTKNNKRIQEIN